MALSHESAVWWPDVPWRDGETRDRPEIEWTRRHVQMIAAVAPESVSFDEAVRMLVGQGLSILQGTYAPPEQGFVDHFDGEEIETERNIWIDDIELDETFSRQLLLPRAAVEMLAEVCPAAMSLQEAVKTVVNVAIEERIG